MFSSFSDIMQSVNTVFHLVTNRKSSLRLKQLESRWIRNRSWNQCFAVTVDYLMTMKIMSLTHDCTGDPRSLTRVHFKQWFKFKTTLVIYTQSFETKSERKTERYGYDFLWQ